MKVVTEILQDLEILKRLLKHNANLKIRINYYLTSNHNTTWSIMTVTIMPLGILMTVTIMPLDLFLTVTIMPLGLFMILHQ